MLHWAFNSDLWQEGPEAKCSAVGLECPEDIVLHKQTNKPSVFFGNPAVFLLSLETSVYRGI